MNYVEDFQFIYIVVNIKNMVLQVKMKYLTLKIDYTGRFIQK